MFKLNENSFICNMVFESKFLTDQIQQIQNESEIISHLNFNRRVPFLLNMICLKFDLKTKYLCLSVKYNLYN